VLKHACSVTLTILMRLLPFSELSKDL